MKNLLHRSTYQNVIIAVVAGFFVLAVVFQGCSSKSGSGGTKSTTNSVTTQITFERIKASPNGQSFKLKLNRKNITPAFVTSVTVSKGTLGSWVQVDQNHIEATITPDVTVPTGKYEINLSTADGKSFQRTPIVVKSVANNWGQPEMFNGLVNTRGWEDSPQAFVVTDSLGKETLYLAMVYLPIRFNCQNNFVSTNPNCQKVIGPYQAPSRPHMTIAPYVAGDGTINQELTNLLGAGVTIGVPKFGASLYLFKFDKDNYSGYLGTASASPQAINITGDDGLIIYTSPYFYKNGSTYSLMYNNNEMIDTPDLACTGYPREAPGSVDRSIDVYIMNNFDFGASNVVLGNYNRVDYMEQFSNGNVNDHANQLPCPELLLNSDHVSNGLPTLSTTADPNHKDQGNPTVYFPASHRPVVVWDLEGSGANVLQMAQLADGGNYPAGPWNMIPTTLPILAAPVSGEKSQPVFTDNKFCYRNEFVIECVAYNGGDPTVVGSYGATTVEMTGTGFSPGLEGELVAVGEPSFFTYQGQNCMSFVYGTKYDNSENSEDDVDIDIGWVCE